jgi:hypothetical protein
MTGHRCLVLGSYPPVPGLPAAATVAAVRRAWADGSEVVVASPRPSAAPIVLTSVATGPALGRELTRLRRQQGCDAVIVCAEPGWPLRGKGAERTARALSGALRRASRTELVVTGPVAELGEALAAMAPLWNVVDLVTAGSEPLTATLRAAGAPSVRTIEPLASAGAGVAYLPLGPAARVSPLEPAELLLVARSRRLLGRTARRLLGRRAPAVRAYVGRMQQSLTLGASRALRELRGFRAR